MASAPSINNTASPPVSSTPSPSPSLSPALPHPPLSPVKSTGDDRSYRLLVLPNLLQALLVHDPDTDKAAAALDVGVGHWADPPHLPGLAHFLEHMLFLGTDKYPDENEYSSFLNAHGQCSRRTHRRGGGGWEAVDEHLASAVARQ